MRSVALKLWLLGDWLHHDRCHCKHWMFCRYTLKKRKGSPGYSLNSLAINTNSQVEGKGLMTRMVGKTMNQYPCRESYSFTCMWKLYYRFPTREHGFSENLPSRTLLLSKYLIRWSNIMKIISSSLSMSLWRWFLMPQCCFFEASC